MRYTNQLNIPLSLAVFLATDDYDYVPNTISATSLLKPVRQYVLTKRVNPEDALVDISALVSARMGTAIHTAIETAWHKNYKYALQALGYPNKVIENILINPEPEELKPDSIPIYMELRSYKDINGYNISGKFDFVAEGKVQDFKSTSVYTYLNQTNIDKYKLQGSIYRWLNQDIITKDEMLINYIFTDWSAVNANSNPAYPPSRVHSQRIPLLSVDETEQYVVNKLKQIELYMDKPDSEIPLCTDEDLWRKPDVWKYYKDPSKTARSTKNFDNSTDAYVHLNSMGMGIITQVKGTVTACKYCPAFAVCEQKDLLIERGELAL